MREFKFRAWDSVNKVMYKHKDINMLVKNMDTERSKKQWYLMQYTGHKTRTFKEIYEGDILGGHPHGTSIVRWNGDSALFETYWFEETERPDGVIERWEGKSLFSEDLHDCFDEWDIIGNIYENPELLK